jgi:hypothetical protein
VILILLSIASLQLISINKLLFNKFDQVQTMFKP